MDFLSILNGLMDKKRVNLHFVEILFLQFDYNESPLCREQQRGNQGRYIHKRLHSYVANVLFLLFIIYYFLITSISLMIQNMHKMLLFFFNIQKLFIPIFSWSHSITFFKHTVKCSLTFKSTFITYIYNAFF